MGAMDRGQRGEHSRTATKIEVMVWGTRQHACGQFKGVWIGPEIAGTHRGLVVIDAAVVKVFH